MQNKIIMSTVFPLANTEAVRFVRNFYMDKSGSLEVVYTRDPLFAQRFGEEVVIVHKWLTDHKRVVNTVEGVTTVYSITEAIDISRNEFDCGRDYSKVDLVVCIGSGADRSYLYTLYKEKGHTFVQEGGGYNVSVGECEGNTISVAPSINQVDDLNVLYLEPTSIVVDWDKVECWAKSKVRKDVSIVTDAQNAYSSMIHLFKK